MEKRFFLALALSFLVLMAYSSMLPKSKPVANDNVTLNSTAFTKNETAEEEKPAVMAPQSGGYSSDFSNILKEKELTKKIETGGLELVFSKKGGYIVEAVHKPTRAKIAINGIGITEPFNSYLYDYNEVKDRIEFIYRDPAGFSIQKIYSITSDYSLQLTVSISGVTYLNKKSYEIYTGVLLPFPKEDVISERYNEVSAYANNVVVRKPAHALKQDLNFDGNIIWTGIRDKYFCSVFLSQPKTNKAVARNLGEKSYGLMQLIALDEKSDLAVSTFDIFLGPQEEKFLRKFRPNTELIVNYGVFDVIAKPLLFLLIISHNVTHNWGWAIILMTIFVFIITSPLTLKSSYAMKRMQRLQPKMEELKVKFKDNPQKLNVEIMQMYKTEKVNPLGGCLPMLLQVPVFFSLYQLLMRLINLKGAGFLWIKDLSEPDRLYVLKTGLPFLGTDVNLLPILMAFVMFFQQKLSTSKTASTPELIQQQKIMGIMMPVLFGVLFYKISSGLVLYWFVNSLLNVGLQWKISKTA